MGGNEVESREFTKLLNVNGSCWLVAALEPYF